MAVPGTERREPLDSISLNYLGSPISYLGLFLLVLGLVPSQLPSIVCAPTLYLVVEVA